MTEESKTKPKRRSQRKIKNYLLSNDAQLRIIVPNLLWMLLITIMTVSIILSPLMMDMFLADDIEVQYRAAITFLSFIKRLVPTVIVMYILIFTHQVIVTHRICGPLVNFSHTFKKLAQGDFTRKVVIRADDYMKEDCENINQMIDNLSFNISKVNGSNDKLIKSLEKIMKRVDDIKTRDQVLEALELIKREAAKVKDDLSGFKV